MSPKFPYITWPVRFMKNQSQINYLDDSDISDYQRWVSGNMMRSLWANFSIPLLIETWSPSSSSNGGGLSSYYKVKKPCGNLNNLPYNNINSNFFQQAATTESSQFCVKLLQKPENLQCLIAKAFNPLMPAVNRRSCVL